MERREFLRKGLALGAGMLPGVGLIASDVFSHTPVSLELNQFTIAEQTQINKFIVEYGSDVKAVDKDGEMLLHKAATNQQDIAVVKYLLFNGANVNAKESNFGDAPLHYAAWSNKNVGITKFLVSNGADVQAKGWCGYTPLHYATWDEAWERIETVKFLVSVGAEVNAISNNGMTPLDMAVQSECTAVVEYLESMGAKTGKDFP
jgi:ankyrin repeat protein